jgi:hypothetical protein
LFFEVFETHAHTSSLVSAGGHCPFGKMYAEASLARLSQITRFRFRLAMEAGLADGDQLGTPSRELGKPDPSRQFAAGGAGLIDPAQA